MNQIKLRGYEILSDRIQRRYKWVNEINAEIRELENERDMLREELF